MAADGTVTGLPSVADIGTHSFTIQLEDVANRSDTALFEMTVMESIVSPINLGTGYDISSVEAAAFRSSGISKAYDSDEDNAYGSAGSYFFGNGVDNTTNSDGTPSWVTAVKLSSRILRSGLPMLIMGSMVKVIPFFSSMPCPNLP